MESRVVNMFTGLESVSRRRNKKIAALEPKVENRLAEERIEKEERLAAMEAQRASNIIEHQDEISARPARSWFQTASERKEVKEMTKAMSEVWAGVSSACWTECTLRGTCDVFELVT